MSSAALTCSEGERAAVKCRIITDLWRPLRGRLSAQPSTSGRKDPVRVVSPFRKIQKKPVFMSKCLIFTPVPVQHCKRKSLGPRAGFQYKYEVTFLPVSVRLKKRKRVKRNQIPAIFTRSLTFSRCLVIDSRKAGMKWGQSWEWNVEIMQEKLNINKFTFHFLSFSVLHLLSCSTWVWLHITCT